MQECDVISVSKSDYIYEYEVKISRADYKKDFIKRNILIINENYTKTRKGELVYLLPNYFNFVTPRDLITIDEVPDYAGLNLDEDGLFESQNYYIKTKANPLLLGNWLII
jgi:hypothetical protein